MPQLIPTELEDGSIIYFQVEGTTNFVSHDRDLLVGDKAQNAAKEKAIQSFQALMLKLVSPSSHQVVQAPI